MIQRKTAMNRFLEAIPITIFLAYLRAIDIQVPGNFKSPFIISGMAAVLLILLFLYKKRPFDRLFLGINLYLISGGFAFITHQFWLNSIYDHLHASGVFLWIIAVGVAALLFSSKGFIGVASSKKNSVKTYSIFLLFFSFLAFAVSFFFRLNKLFPEFIPFICLFLLQDYLKNKLVAEEQKQGESAENSKRYGTEAKQHVKRNLL